jgi:hypothetical protein
MVVRETVRERSFLRFMAVPVRARRNGPLAEVETAIPRVIHAQHTSVLEQPAERVWIEKTPAHKTATTGRSRWVE